MVAIAIAMLGAVLFAVHPSLVEGYYLPKLIGLILAGSLSTVIAVSRDELKIPKASLALTSWIAFVLLSFAYSAQADSWTSFSLYFAATSIFVFIFNFSEKQKLQLRSSLFILAQIQLLFWATQFLVPEVWIDLPINFIPERSSALVGNREFLSTFIGLALLLKYPKPSELFNKTGLANLAVLALNLIALAALGSKGTLYLIFLVWMIPAILERPLASLGIILIPVILFGLFSISARARFLLILVSGISGINGFPWGLGPDTFGSHYFSSLEELFIWSPELRASLGDLAGVVNDAHNFPLNSLAELGLVGGGLSILILVGLFKLAIKSKQHQDRSCLIFILCKMLYTVVLASPVSILACSSVLSLTLAKKETRVIRLSIFLKSCWLIFSAFIFMQTCHTAYIGSLYSKGYRALRDQNFASARDYFAKVIAIKPNHSDALLGLAFVSINSKPYIKPEPYLTKALSLPLDFNKMKLAAKIYLESGDCYHAIAIYKRIHTAYPQHLTTISNLARCSLKLGDKVSARYFAELVLKTQPRKPTKTYALNLLTSTAVLEKLDL